MLQFQLLYTCCNIKFQNSELKKSLGIYVLQKLFLFFHIYDSITSFFIYINNTYKQRIKPFKFGFKYLNLRTQNPTKTQNQNPILLGSGS